jgi:hypothetical protein
MRLIYSTLLTITLFSSSVLADVIYEVNDHRIKQYSENAHKAPRLKTMPIDAETSIIIDEDGRSTGHKHQPRNKYVSRKAPVTHDMYEEDEDDGLPRVRLSPKVESELKLYKESLEMLKRKRLELYKNLSPEAKEILNRTRSNLPKSGPMNKNSRYGNHLID